MHHYVARENTYKENATICECSEATVKRAMKQIHKHEEANLSTALNDIFDEAERNEEFLTCKKIKNLLNEKFNLLISLKNLYCELQRVSSFRYPSTVPKLTESNKQLRVEHCIIVNKSNIDNWIFTDESSI